MQIIRKINKNGNSRCLVLDKTIRILSEIDYNDLVEVKCSKNKIVLTKVENKGE